MIAFRCGDPDRCRSVPNAGRRHSLNSLPIPPTPLLVGLDFPRPAPPAAGPRDRLGRSVTGMHAQTCGPAPGEAWCGSQYRERMLAQPDEHKPPTERATNFVGLAAGHAAGGVTSRPDPWPLALPTDLTADAGGAVGGIGCPRADPTITSRAITLTARTERSAGRQRVQPRDVKDFPLLLVTAYLPCPTCSRLHTARSRTEEEAGHVG
jgi:hypothetical protein